jgi:two-component system chemotaxis response regulator CheB/chemosensory pili system protein ChpB (putative protein-glutamate methylesterase)
MSEAGAVPVALFYPTDAAGAHLRAALARCGTEIVYEALAGQADRDDLEQSGARVVVVDLDAEVDRYLDDMQSLLAGSEYRIVFNDGQVSSGLSGWDHARWMRHLAAKIRGRNETDPPRPPGAVPVPTRADIARAAHAAVGVTDTSGAVPPDVGDPMIDATRAQDEDLRVDDDSRPATQGVLTDSGVLAPEAEPASDEPVIAPEIEERDVERSDAPDFSGWSIDEPVEEPPPVPVDAPDAAEFGVDIVDPEEYLAPPEPPSPVAAGPRGTELELVPLDIDLPPVSNTPDHENWLETMAEPIERVWILAAATGGPQAVRGVLAGLSDNHPAVFLLAQQVGEEFADVLLDQLAGSTALRVRRAVSGERARRGDVLVVEAGQAVGLDRSGIVRTQADMAPVPLESVLCDAAAGFGARAGAIIFSGVSVELLDALRDLRDQGGEVWVQDPATCLVGALAEAAAEAGVATFVGSPDELAERLAAQAGEPGPRSPLSRG